MNKLISSLFVTTFLVQAPLAVFAMEDKEKEKEERSLPAKKTERAACSINYDVVLQQAEELFKDDSRSLEGHLILTQVVRAGLNSEKKDEFNKAEEAYNKLNAFMRDPDNSPLATNRIAIEIADLLTLPSHNRSFAGALDLLNSILEAGQHYNTFPQILNNIIDSEEAKVEEKEQAHHLLIKYAHRFCEERIIEEYLNTFKFYKANPLPEGADTRPLHIVGELVDHVESNSSFEGYLALAKYYDAQDYEDKGGTSGLEWEAARQYYMKAAEFKADIDVLKTIRERKQDFFKTPEEFYIYLIKLCQQYPEYIDKGYIFAETMEEEDSSTARFLKLYFSKGDKQRHREEVERFFKEDPFFGYPLYAYQLAKPLSSLLNNASAIEADIENAVYQGDQIVQVYDATGINCRLYSMEVAKKIVEEDRNKANHIKAELQRLKDEQKNSLMSLVSKDLHEKTMLYHLMFHNNALSLNSLWGDAENEVSRHYESCLEILAQRGYVEGLNDFISLCERDKKDQKKQVLQELLAIRTNNDLDLFEMQMRYDEKLSELK